MLFFEQSFLVFFFLFSSCYWALSPARRPLLILLFSYAFYAAWDWRFLSLLLLSTTVDYACANLMRRKRWKTVLLMVSLSTNLGLLMVFKYYDFFIQSFADLVGVTLSDAWLLEVILPAGISFYTFQTIGYTVDVYRGRLKPEKNPITFAAFVAFFPQLVAGPIERAGDLLPQIVRETRFSVRNLALGGRLFLFGLFKKLVVADTLGRFVDPVFADPGGADPLVLLLAAYAFAFQIYCDFSGYTDMARGLAKTIGIDLSINFNAPYFASSIRDFWQRWHITLYSWLRDYVYRPLGGSHGGQAAMVRNIMVVFVLSGLWHGAAWTFVLWGALQGALIVGERVLAPTALGRALGHLPKALRVVIVFHLVTAGWILFRAESFAHLADYARGLAALRPGDFLFAFQSIETPQGALVLPTLGDSVPAFLYAFVLVLYAGPLVCAGLYKARSGRARPEAHWPVELQGAFFATLAILTWWLKSNEVEQFIYFQF